MTFLKSVRVDVCDREVTGGHPFDVPAIAAMVADEVRLRFDQGVTVFVGDNGSGKSTLLEAIAVSQDLNAEGGSRHIRFQTHGSPVSSLHEHVRVSRSARRPRDAFFLRAESYFNVATAIEEHGTAAQYGDRRISGRTVSRSSILPFIASGRMVCTCSTSPKRPCRFTANSSCSSGCSTSSMRAHSSCWPLTRRC